MEKIDGERIKKIINDIKPLRGEYMFSIIIRPNDTFERIYELLAIEKTSSTSIKKLRILSQLYRILSSYECVGLKNGLVVYSGLINNIVNSWSFVPKDLINTCVYTCDDKFDVSELEK